MLYSSKKINELIIETSVDFKTLTKLLQSAKKGCSWSPGNCSCNQLCNVWFPVYHQPDKEVAEAAISMSQQALDSLVPKPPNKKGNKSQEVPKELGNPV